MDKQTRVQPGDGDVSIVLLGEDDEPETFVLRPSMRAAQILTTKFGGLTKVLQHVADGDFAALTQIVTVGLGYSTQTKPAPAWLAERVWRTGFGDGAEDSLVGRCVLYVRVLLNGGRRPADVPAEALEVHEDPPAGT